MQEDVGGEAGGTTGALLLAKNLEFARESQHGNGSDEGLRRRAW